MEQLDTLVAFLIKETIADVHVVTVWFGVGGSGMDRKQNFFFIKVVYGTSN